MKNNKLMLSLLLTIFVVAGTSVIAYAEDDASKAPEPSVDPITGFVKGTGEVIAGAGEGTGKVLKGTAEGTGQAVDGAGKGTGEVVEGMGKGTQNFYEGVTQKK